MTQQQIESVGWKLAQHWNKVEHLNPKGLTESWIKNALIGDGVFATPRTLARISRWVADEIKQRENLGLREAAR